MTDAENIRLDRAFSPEITLFGMDFAHEFYLPPLDESKRARIKKLAEEIPSPPEDKEPF